MSQENNSEQQNPATIGAIGGGLERQRRGVRRTVSIVVVAMVCLVGGFFYSMTQSRELDRDALKSMGAYLYENPRMLPGFNLVDNKGAAFTPSGFMGKWNLVFFGFTYCPDICPTTLAQLKTFYTELPAEVRADTQVWLASVDPARDTPQSLDAYLAFFHPAFRGITGEFLDIHRLATSLNIPFAKVPGGGEDYLVEHSGNVALINPEGHSLGFFKAPLEIGKLTQSYMLIHQHFTP
ncbi:SCO family protein [Spongiibacter sp. KMU-158]|uniref:SCO family protein n=1 Tax=Spongiibacter pelagi TaxID=2760804 RepID=A0A927C0I3_9GAMM|nr:SCO family protein [Spongiibacter pelagi]MBD2857556.1 SCO family protein [Spongiibacter pelagi]